MAGKFSLTRNRRQTDIYFVCKFDIQARTSAQIHGFERKFDKEAALNRSNMSGLADGLNELQANMRCFVEAFMSLQPDGTGELRNTATPNEITDSRAVDKVHWLYLSLNH